MQNYPGHIIHQSITSKEEVIDFTEKLINYLFPVVVDEEAFLMQHDKQQQKLIEQLKIITAPLCEHKKGSNSFSAIEYFNNLHAIKNSLLEDAKLILAFDPAASSIEEVILTYPGFFAIAVHRLSHILYNAGVPILPRMMSEFAHSKTGIDINPGAKIGSPFFIDHGTGIVIGETTNIGNNVKIYQGVTLGAVAVKKELAKIKRHPTIEDNVLLYAGCTILGGETVIGHDSIIGGNTWITQSILPYSVVVQKNQIIITNRHDLDEGLNFII